MQDMQNMNYVENVCWVGTFPNVTQAYVLTYLCTVIAEYECHMSHLCK